MKALFCLLPFIFFLTVNCVSQDSATYVFHIDKLPPEGILLDKGWKFQAGDNPDWAKPEFDDGDWQAIDPTKDIHELPQLQKRIGWFRLKQQIDSTILVQPLALIINQSGASEIYFNGKLLHRFGIVSAHPDKIIAYDPVGKPVLLQYIKDGENT